MKSRFILMFSLFLFSQSLYANWYSESELCEAKDKDAGCLEEVTPKGGFGEWAAKILEIEYNNKKATGNILVQVTWVSPRSDYNCGQTLTVKYGVDVKDFTHRSLAMKQCS